MIREIPDLLYDNPKMVTDHHVLQAALNEAFSGKTQAGLTKRLEINGYRKGMGPQSVCP